MEYFDGNPIELVLNVGHMFLSLAVFLFLMYIVQVQSLRSRTKKYKFVSEKERQAMQGSSIIFSCAISIYAFVIIGISIGLSNPYQYVLSGFFALLIGFALAYVLWQYLSYYHPFILEKRLKDIRFSPMKSPKTGKPMTLLNESQEDAHLSQEMIEEEDTLSVDYDVWIDEETNFKVIERYNTRYHPLVCESCNFRTLTERKEEIIKEPQQSEKGILRKQYQCSYCGHLESKDVPLPSWDEEKKYQTYEKDLLEFPPSKSAHS